MNILAIDSSGKTAGVCICSGGSLVFSKALDQGLTHSQTLCPLIAQGLNTAGLKPAEIDVYAASAGPGSFTGLRIGLSVIKGLCLPFGTPVAPVSTLAALAASLERVLGEEECLVATALDARRGEVYFAAFRWNGTALERLVEDRAGPAGQMAGLLAAWRHLPLLLVGDGAYLCEEAFGGFALRGLGKFRPNIAEGVAARAGQMYREGTLQQAGSARPVYLRLSQAERQRKQAAADICRPNV